MSSIRLMRRVKQIVVVLLVALWLPASSHALLEHAGLIHQQHEQGHAGNAETDHHADSDDRHEHKADNHAAADGLCRLATGKVQAPSLIFVATPGWLAMALMTLPVDAGRAEVPSGLSPPGTCPPELSHRWQFSSRAALPVRAPSFAS